MANNIDVVFCGDLIARVSVQLYVACGRFDGYCERVAASSQNHLSIAFVNYHYDTVLKVTFIDLSASNSADQRAIHQPGELLVLKLAYIAISLVFCHTPPCILISWK
jgi:hypothetical protein